MKVTKVTKMPTTFYKYILEPYRGQQTRHTCPNCHGRKEFTRYIDTETGLYLAEHVGKCNRESKCGYHYSPRDYFRDDQQFEKNYWRRSDLWQTVYKSSEGKPVDYISCELMEKSFGRYERNNFIRYLHNLFEEEKVYGLVEQFKLGTSKHWKNDDGLAVVFWQVDIAGKVRQAKVMAYHPEIGRRLKAEDEAYRYSSKSEKYHLDIGNGAKVYFAGKSLTEGGVNLQQCFFGEHQLADRADAAVAIVESEKTAVIMTGFFPEIIWLATGGTNGARWTDRSVYNVLRDRRVILYPDLGAYRKWSDKAKIMGTVCEVSISDLLERKAVGNDLQAGYDLADYFV